MKVGDLVNFNAKSWVFKSANIRYKNPGVIVNVHERANLDQKVAEVMWADGKFTSEYAAYLHKVEGTMDGDK